MQKKVDKPKIAVGYMVVGTWIHPKNELGGATPIWLSRYENEAIESSNLKSNSRLKKFKNQTSLWLCKVKIKPLKKLKYINRISQ